MKINRTHRVLVLAAIFHLLADVAFAGGAVLCVGANGHAEIETSSFARDCGFNRTANVQQGGPEFATSAANGCTDVPLHSDAELVSESHSWEPGAQAIVASSFGPPSLHKLGSDVYIGQGTDLTSTMRAHRSIVLII